MTVGPAVRHIRRFDPDLLEPARELRATQGAARTMLGLVGEPGAGKSLVAAALVRLLGAGAVQVPMDGYHLADAVLREHGTLGLKGAPQTFDGFGYRDFLRRIRADDDHPLYAPEFERELEQPIANAIAVRPEHRLVVSEGNYLLLGRDPWPAVAECFDRIWFLDVDADLRLERLIARHVEFGKTPDQARAWVLAKDERNAELIRATRERADLILDVTELTPLQPDDRAAASAP